jgi:hypothetical protein
VKENEFPTSNVERRSSVAGSGRKRQQILPYSFSSCFSIDANCTLHGHTSISHLLPEKCLSGLSHAELVKVLMASRLSAVRVARKTSSRELDSIRFRRCEAKHGYMRRSRNRPRIWVLCGKSVIVSCVKRAARRSIGRYSQFRMGNSTLISQFC